MSLRSSWKTQEVIDCLDDYGITLHSQTSAAPYPAYSHCFMPLDYRLFSPYQQTISTLTKRLERERAFNLYTDTRLSLLYDLITPNWETDEMIQMAANTIDNYGDVCRRVIELEGNIKGFK
eukprot:654294_1